MILFKLTMPNVGSWNGKWTGEGNLYCISRKLSKPIEENLDGKDFFYRWEDGWSACVSCTKMSAVEARRLTKKSKGFYGYNWMVDSILKYGEIRVRTV